MELKIDYSRIPQNNEVIAKTSYRPPRNVYFGKRGEDGMMEERPIYVHQEYPRMMYKVIDGVIVADLVHDDTSKTLRLGAGWVKNVAELGLLTAPSFEQLLEMKQKPLPEAKAAETLANLAASEPDTGAGEKKWRDMNAEERAAFQAKKAAKAA